MSVGSACYTLAPINPKFNYDYLIADYNLKNTSALSVNIIRDNGDFKNNLINGTGNINTEFLSIQRPFINNNIEYQNFRQELLIYGKFSYDTLPNYSNIFYFSTDSNIRNLLKLDILQNSNIKVSYSNSNIGYYSNIINPVAQLGAPPYNFIIGLYNGVSSNILDLIVLNSNNTIYSNTTNFIPIHNIYDNYHKNTLSLGSSNIKLYDFRIYNKYISPSESLPDPITILTPIVSTYSLILDPTTYRNTGLYTRNIRLANTSFMKSSINNNNNIYLLELEPDTEYELNIELFDNYENTYYTTQTITTNNNTSLTSDSIVPFNLRGQEPNSALINSNDINMIIGATSVLYTGIVGVDGINSNNSYGIRIDSSNIGISKRYDIDNNFHADIYIDNNNWNLTVNINKLEPSYSYKPTLLLNYILDDSIPLNIIKINLPLPEFRL